MNASKKMHTMNACAAMSVICGVIACMVCTGMGCGSNAPATMMIKGVVRDAVTGQPIAEAVVLDDGYGPVQDRRSGTTDASGQYQYYTWPEEHCLLAQAPGYVPKRSTVTTYLFKSNAEKRVDFLLEPEQSVSEEAKETTIPE